MPEVLEADELDTELAALPREAPTIAAQDIDAELAALPREQVTVSTEAIDAELAALPRETVGETGLTRKQLDLLLTPGSFISLDPSVSVPPPKTRAEANARLLAIQEARQRLETTPMVPLRIQEPKTVPAGIYNALAAVPEFLTSALGTRAMIASAFGGPLAARTVAGGFLADVAGRVPQQVKEIREAVKQGPPGRAAEAITGGVMTPFFLRALYRGATRPLPRPVELPVKIAPIDVATEVRPVPLELTAEPTALKGGPEPFFIETADLTDKKVYGPGGEAGHVTWSGIGIVEADTGKGVKTWRKSELDQERLFSDYSELKGPQAKVEPFVEERPPDIIDAIKDTQGNERVINAKEVHSVDPNFPKNGFELNRTGWPRWFKKLFYYPKEGESKRGHPQDVLNGLQRDGFFTNLEDSPDAFMDELFRAFEQRRSGAKVESREAKLLAEQEREAIERERAEKIVEVAFENEERAAMAEAEKLGSKGKIVDVLPEDPNRPFARAIAPDETISTIAPDGTVLFNRPVLNRWLRSVTPEDRPDAIRALVHEELTHSKVTNADAVEYWNALTAVEQALVRRRYGGPAEGRPAFTDAQLGHESLRARLQQLSGMTPREVYGLRGAERLTVRTILALERIVFNLRRALGTRASALQTEMLDRVQRNLHAARDAAVRSGEAPAAFLRREGELPLEEGPPEKERKPAVALPRGAVALERPSREARRLAFGRKEVTPAEIGWELTKDVRSGRAYRPVTPAESQNLRVLGSILTQGARLQVATPGVTKRVTAILNNRTGTVDLLSTFAEHGRAMILDPLRAGLSKPHVHLGALLGRVDREGKPVYRVLDSYLLEQPVKDFRQRFESAEHYEAQFRNEVSATAQARAGAMPELGLAGEFDAQGRPVRIVTEPVAEVGVLEEPFGDIEGGRLYDHLYDTVGKLESPEDIKLAMEDLADRPNRQIATSYLKWYDTIRRENPDLSPDVAMRKLWDDVYQNAKNAPNREAFVARARQRNRAEDIGDVPGVEAPKSVQEQIDPPAAFWRGAQEGGKHIAERLISEPARLYSEWMVDRLERTGGPLSKAFAQTLRRVVDRQKQLEGELTPVLDPAIKAAGKPGRATTWFHQFAERPTPYTAIRNSAPALESIGRPGSQWTVFIPEFARPLARLGDAANRAIGSLYEGVSRLEEAWGGFQRNITGIGYDIIRRGLGPMWERWTAGLAAANNKPLFEVHQFFSKWKAMLDDPARKSTDLETVNQDFRRVFPKAITDVRDPFGNWQPVVHADLFAYLQNAAKRATHVRAFREVFPATDAGRAAFDRALNGPRDAQGRPTGEAGKSIRADTPGEIHADLEALIRALNGHPTDNYSNASMALSASAPGTLFRYLNNTLGNLAARAVLTGQMLTQLPETLVGAAPQFLGLRRYVRGLVQLRQLWTELERAGKRNAVIYDWSLDPRSPIRSAFRIAGNVLSKWFAENFLNELQEGAAAATAKILSDDIRSGAMSSWDRRVLPQSFKAMGFSERQASDMLSNLAPHLLEQFERRAAAFLTGGNKAIAEGSRLGANRLFNSVFRFQTYPMMKMNQFRKVLAGLADAETPQQKLAAAELFARFLFGSTLQGALTVAVVTLFTEGLSGLMVKKEEAEDQPLKFLAESAISTMSGPLYLIFRGARDKGIAGVGEQAMRAFFPYSMLRDLTDMTSGQGQYRDMDTWSRLGKFVQQKTPGTKPIRVALATVGLAQADLKTEAAIRAFRRWQREQPGYELAGMMPNEDERGRFRTAMKKAATALQRGDARGFEEALDEAVGEAAKLPSKQPPQQRVAASLRARRILQTPAGKYYFGENGDPVNPELLKRLESRIGPDGVNRLRYYDAMLEQMAEALNP